MQTFLPYQDFAASARVLDSMRLGKQRLEALQCLRGLVLPVYGFSTHPAVRMWRGHVPALTLYTAAIIDEWTARGNRDTIRPLVLEFAPEVDSAPQESLSMPPWLGEAAFHESHQSNLVRKLPEHYRPFFSDVADDLPYFWPVTSAREGVDRIASTGEPIWVLRARSQNERDEWVATSFVTFPSLAPNGARSKAWGAQSDAFAALDTGDRIAVACDGSDVLPSGVVTSEASGYQRNEETGLRLSIDFDSELGRSAFPAPVLLQDPRSLFRVAARR